MGEGHETAFVVSLAMVNDPVAVDTSATVFALRPGTWSISIRTELEASLNGLKVVEQTELGWIIFHGC